MCVRAPQEANTNIFGIAHEMLAELKEKKMQYSTIHSSHRIRLSRFIGARVCVCECGCRTGRKNMSMHTQRKNSTGAKK